MPIPACDYASVLLRLRTGSTEDNEALHYAIKEAKALDALAAGVDGEAMPMRDLVDSVNKKVLGLVSDLPSVFLQGAASVRASEAEGVSSSMPSRQLFPLRAHFAPNCGFLLTPDQDWLSELCFSHRGGDALRCAHDATVPQFRLHIPLRIPPVDDIERATRCCVQMVHRRRKDRIGFRYRAVVSAVPYVFADGTLSGFTYRGGMTPQWLTEYAFALRNPLAPKTVRCGEFGKPISIHIGWLSQEDMAGGSSGFYAVLTARKPSTLAKANQLPKTSVRGSKLLPNGKVRRTPWASDLEQLSLLSEQPF